jgi:hypothetical protein
LNVPPDRRLSRHLRFARSLALVSGATIGIAAGAALVVPSGCGNGCIGAPCGNFIPPPAQPDAGADAHTASDAARDAIDPEAGLGGGGPLAAPPLPASWLA